MRRSKRFSIKLVAVGFAAAALAAPSAQAMPDLPGDEVRALQEAKAKSVRAAGTVKSTQRIRLPRRPIREYEPE
jgi:uncharacterized lipoprotein YbaY